MREVKKYNNSDNFAELVAEAYSLLVPSNAFDDWLPAG